MTRFISTFLLLALATPAALASAPTTQPALTPSDKLAVTNHQITLPGGPLKYTATAGYLPLKDEAGKLRANFFFIAYTKDAPDDKASGGRPITFIFNGGPGAAAVWLHLGTAGPRRVVMADNGEAPAPPYKLTDNQSTWLTDTDLVFIDPVGTGYSRAATPEQNKDFYNFHEDINSLADFIRLYLTRFQRWDSPKFVAGESYGGTRAAALSQRLQDQGIALSGVVLISPALNFHTFQPSESNELPFALFLPTYTASAFYHKKLSPDLSKDLDKTLAEAKDFALTAYTLALAKGSDLPVAERKTILEKLSRYTGLSTEFLDKANLRVDPWRFEKALLENEKDGAKIIGRFDSRLTAPASDPLASGPDFDPSLSAILPVYAATINAYVRETLRYENDLPYEVLKPMPFDFQGQPPYVGDDLRNAMRKNPNLKVLLASGRFDLAVPFAASDYVVTHLNLPPTLRPNLTQTYYPAGHMFYHHQGALKQFHTDLSNFMRNAVAPAVNKPSQP